MNDPTITTNKPIANPDVATTKGDPTAPVAVTVNVKANDGPGNSNGTLGTPTIPSQPAHGTATVDGSGNVVYTPAAGFYGIDVVTYQVCETPSTLCATSTVTVTVVAPDATDLMAAADDYANTIGVNPVSGNVLTNDKGTGTLTVTNPATTVVAGKGTVTLGANGAYSFTAIAGYVGTVDVPYTVRDANGAVAAATLHVEVKPFELNPDFNATTVGVPVTGSVKTNDLVPAGSTYGTPTQTGNPTTTIPTMTSTGTYTFVETTPGIYTFNVPVCPPGQSTGCPTAPLTISVNDPTITTNKPIANPDVATTKGDPTAPVAVTVNVKAKDGPGNSNGTLGTPTIPSQPAHGTATVDGSGNVVYTPAAGFYGIDVVTYQVCETPSTLCTTSTVTVTVVAPDATDLLAAADDYASTIGVNPVSGNVLTNDKGTGTLTVTNPATTVVAGKGTVTLGATGAYSFTAIAGYVGTVDVPYTVRDANGAVAAATLHVEVKPFELNPDFNATTVGVPVTGSVKTNDLVPAGSTYGTPVTTAGNPTTTIPTMTSTGTYTFTETTPGIYTFNVPVCPPGQSTGCPTAPLTISVNDPTITTNKPIANPDVATTKGDPTAPVAVTVNVKANDGPGNSNGTLGTPTIPSQPAHGTATVDGSGNVVYTPAAGFYGIDVVTYQVCETPSTLCATSTVTVTVVAPDATDLMAAADDYNSTIGTATATGNVLTNDKGTGSLTVTTPGTTVIPGKGTATLAANGTYSFVPVAGYVGTVDVPYTAKDANNATATATLHVEVKPFELNPDFNATTVGVPVTGSVKTNDVVPSGSTYGTPTQTGNPTATIPTMTSTGTYTFTETTPGIYTFSVPVCPPGQSTGCPTAPLTITVNDARVRTNMPVANPDVATTKGDPTAPVPVTVNAKANDAPGNANGTLGTPAITAQPAHGSASVDGSGNVVYTPAAGFYGIDVVTYQVCESPSALCTTATVTVTVVAPDAPDLLAAADDYTSTIGSRPVSGNVLTNDKGTGTLTVTNPATTTVPGVGTVTLGSNGAYSFTAVTGYIGTLDVPYTVQDAAGSIAVATLHIQVKERVLLVSPTALLQGPLVSTTMTTTLNTLNLIPKNQPYNVAPFNYAGTEQVTTVPASATDWVLVELRDPSTPGTILATKAGFMLNTGLIVSTDGATPLMFTGLDAGNYHIAVRHRNHLGIRTAATQGLIYETINTYDFTTGAGQANGTNAMINVGTVYAMWAGDVVKDGKVASGASPSDVNSVQNAVANFTSNVLHSPVYSLYKAYDNNDVNMDGFIKSGASPSDVNFIQNNVANYPANTLHSPVYNLFLERL